MPDISRGNVGIGCDDRVTTLAHSGESQQNRLINEAVNDLGSHGLQLTEQTWHDVCTPHDGSFT